MMNSTGIVESIREEQQFVVTKEEVACAKKEIKKLSIEQINQVIDVISVMMKIVNTEVVRRTKKKNKNKARK